MGTTQTNKQTNNNNYYQTDKEFNAHTVRR